MKNAPIILFAYKRLDTLKQTVAALRSNELASDSELFIFSDAGKTQADIPGVEQVRSYLRTITGFKSIHISEASSNKGLAASIVEGVTEVLRSHRTVIVLEDDLVVSFNFLAFMNQCLNFYQAYSNVLSISGYTIPLSIPKDYEHDVYAFPRVSSHGWATWRDKWARIDWEVKDFDKLQNSRSHQKQFNTAGSDLYRMLSRQMRGKIDSWAIRWQYHLFNEQLLTIYPVVSKVQNMGFGNEATHSKGYNRFVTKIDTSENTQFKLLETININDSLFDQLADFYSIKSRSIAKVKTYLLKVKALQHSFR